MVSALDSMILNLVTNLFIKEIKSSKVSINDESPID